MVLSALRVGTMIGEEVLQRFDDLNTLRQGAQRAPVKPLLVLDALGRWQHAKAELTFAEAEPALNALLRESGPPRKLDHAEQPFWRLQLDGARACLPLKTGDDIPRVATPHRRPFPRSDDHGAGS